MHPGIEQCLDIRRTTEGVVPHISDVILDLENIVTLGKGVRDICSVRPAKEKMLEEMRITPMQVNRSIRESLP